MHRMLFPVLILVVVLMVVLVIMIPFRARFSVHRVNYTGMVMVGNHVVRRYYCETKQQEQRYVLFPDQCKDIYVANIIKNLSGAFSIVGFSAEMQEILALMVSCMGTFHWITDDEQEEFRVCFKNRRRGPTAGILN